MKNIDLIIIGAGPAGLSTAMHLVQGDPSWLDRLIVLDKAAHPRPKLCGGGVTQLGLRTLHGLNFPDPLPIPSAPVEDARFLYKDRVIHVRGSPEFIVYNRIEFDNYLAKEAKKRRIQICENETVKSLDVKDGRVTVTTSREIYHARMVVGADGSKGITGKYVRGLTNRRSRNQAVKQNHSPVARLLEIITPAPETAPLFNERYAVFDFTHVNRNLQGYFWDFPARVGGEPHFNRGVFDSRFVGSAPKASLPKVLGDALEEIGTDPESVEIKGHPIHWFRPQNIFSAPHILLVGDAAGAEPLFGEGIAPALGYGRLAEKEIVDAFNKDDFSLSTYKRRILLSEVGFYLTFRWWIASWSYPLVKQAWFMHLFWTVGPVLSAIKNFVQRFIR